MPFLWALGVGAGVWSPSSSYIAFPSVKHSHFLSEGMNLTGNWGKVMEKEEALAARREAVAAAMAAGLMPSSPRAEAFQYENRFNDPKVIWRRQFQVG